MLELDCIVAYNFFENLLHYAHNPHATTYEVRSRNTRTVKVHNKKNCQNLPMYVAVGCRLFGDFPVVAATSTSLVPDDPE